MSHCPVCGAAHAACGGPSDPNMIVTDPQPPMALPSSKTMWRSDRRVYLDKDGQVVADESKQDPVTLLVAEGHEIPLARAKALGLVKDDADPGAPAPFHVQNLGDGSIAALTLAGMFDPAKLNKAKDEDLLAIDGIDQSAVTIIREALKG